MNRGFPLTGLGFALFAAACSSQPSAGHGRGAGGTSTAGNPARVGGSGGVGANGGAPGSSGGGASGSVNPPVNGGSTAMAGHPGSTAGAGGNSPSGAGQNAGGNSGGIANGNAGTNAGGNPNSSLGGQSGAGAVSNAGMAGAVTGGAGMSSSSTLPAFVTSAPNDYWNTQGTVTALTTGTPNLVVDPTTKYQQFTGFGGCFNEMGWDALSVLGTDDVTRAMKLLFDATDGANFVYGRLPMGASDYAMSWYTLDDTSSADYSMTSFSIARDEQKLIPFIKAAVAVRPDIMLWTSPWVVPKWMMDSSSNMKNDPQTLGAHALYMARFVEEYAKDGLTIAAVHPQNEPGYAQVHWTQSEFVDFIKTYLGPTFAQRNLTAEIWCGTMSKDPDDTNFAKAVAADADAMKYVKGFGVQWNLEAAVATLAQSGPVWQTEHRCGNYSFMSPYWDQSRYNSKMPQNDHAYGEESWQLIRDWLVAGVNSYSAWNMVLDTVGMSLGNWPQNALLTVDRTAKKLNVTAAYYAFRHYSQYIQANATRIGLTGSTDALAFQNPDGSVVTEVYNGTDSAETTSVGLGSTGYQFDVPAHGWATLLIAP
jgi:glucosylceramidase